MSKLPNAAIAEQYNQAMADKYQNDYEFNRWFIRARNRAEYAMTYQAIKHHLQPLRYTRCLELGPGPGTWTRLLYRHNPTATYQLVDISEAMREQFTLEMRTLPNVTYTLSDIAQFESAERFDIFFSSRAIEYLDDKPAFFAQLKTLLKPGSTGVVITKNPYHGIRKSKKATHQGQLTIETMHQSLREHGFTDISSYPVVVRIPLMSRLTSEVAEYFFKQWYTEPLAPAAKHRLIESYITVFTLAE
ncbi:hypothetical protein CL655_02050 [bacterium]|nr:hypothetical protein [bacterium]|tara:strand:+ start:791 stop:1528 length:738 start_codon:yes stop_codon:yes gene_type:complete